MGFWLNHKFLKACASGTQDDVERLLAQGADANVLNRDGDTPAVAAAKGG